MTLLCDIVTCSASLVLDGIVRMFHACSSCCDFILLTFSICRKYLFILNSCVNQLLFDRCLDFMKCFAVSDRINRVNPFACPKTTCDSNDDYSMLSSAVSDPSSPNQLQNHQHSLMGQPNAGARREKAPGLPQQARDILPCSVILKPLSHSQLQDELASTKMQRMDQECSKLQQQQQQTASGSAMHDTVSHKLLRRSESDRQPPQPALACPHPAELASDSQPPIDDDKAELSSDSQPPCLEVYASDDLTAHVSNAGHPFSDHMDAMSHSASQEIEHSDYDDKTTTKSWSQSFESTHHSQRGSVEREAMVSRERDPFLGSPVHTQHANLSVGHQAAAPVLLEELRDSPVLFELAGSPAMPDLHDSPHMMPDYDCMPLPVHLGCSPVPSPGGYMGKPGSLGSVEDSRTWEPGKHLSIRPCVRPSGSASACSV